MSHLSADRRERAANSAAKTVRLTLGAMRLIATKKKPGRMCAVGPSRSVRFPRQFARAVCPTVAGGGFFDAM